MRVKCWHTDCVYDLTYSRREDRILLESDKSNRVFEQARIAAITSLRIIFNGIEDNIPTYMICGILGGEEE